MDSDIVIMGGGPAGSVLAAQLCALGFTVSLISRPRRIRAIEGLSERARKGLEFAGFQRTVGSVASKVGRVAMWNGQRHEANHEWIVDRSTFDRGLLADAGRRGVRVLHGSARRFDHAVSGWDVTWTAADRSERRLKAAYLVDARGRASRRAAGQWITGPATFALARRCRSSDKLPSRTVVLTVPEGWVWLAHDAYGSRALVQLFVSTVGQPLPPRPQIDEHFERVLSAVAGPAEGLLDLRREGRVEVRDATTALRRTAIGEGFACAGDAALAIDPLAGHGMYEAVSGALALAPTINTVLRRPRDAAVAERFYREKLETDFWRLARTGRDFYRIETRWPSADFWRERRTWPDQQPAHGSLFSGEAAVEPRPVSENGFIVERPVVVTADHPRGVWQVAGVPLATLHELARSQPGPPETWVRSAARRFNVAPDAIDAALAWLRFRGLLPGT